MANSSEAKNIADPQEQSQIEAREAVRLRSVPVGNAPDASRIADKAADTITKTAEATVQIGDAATHATQNMTQAAVDLGQEVAREGLGAAAGAMASLVDASADRSRRLVETTARVTDVYQDAVKRTADDTQALVGAYSNIGRGFRQYQHACLDLVGRSMGSMARKQMNLFGAKSPVAFAEIQRDNYVDSVSTLLSGSTTLLELAGQITQGIVLPLQERARAHGQG